MSLVGGACGQSTATATLTIDASRPGGHISTNLFGIFFEEINFAGEGGLYAELVRNRSFENSTNADFWTLVTQGTDTGAISVDTGRPLNTNNPRSLKLTLTSGTGSLGAGNAGFWGLALQQGALYDLSLYASGASGFTGPLRARLESADGTKLYAQTTFGGLTTNWQRYAASLASSATDTNARLVVSLAQPGTVWLDVVSLFPRSTFHGRTNGLRADLGQWLADLNPAFLRFPGGNFVEGATLADAVRWKTTLGDIASRPGHWNSAWNYLSTDGLGQHEYLQLCEDLGCEPLFVAHCGLSLGYNGSTNNTVPLDQMGPWVQDALDAIEYANGDTNTVWGARRAANGHPAPFNLKFLEIGNENGGTYYNDRYALFYDAIKSNYPNLHLIACVWGGVPSSRPLEIQDEHYYSDWTFFANAATKYDSYSRSGPKVYVGEYAVTADTGNGNLQAALGEAAFMTGLERNSDVVLMASYAPLLANVNGIQWRPDAIYYDSARVNGTPSYHVQKLFAQNQGEVVLPVGLSVTLPADTNQAPHGAIGLGAWNTQVEYTNVVVASNGVTLFQSDFTSSAAGWQVSKGTWVTGSGLYRQTANITDCRATTGSTAWSDYTLTMRARKTGGSEGFLILFHWLADVDWTWWNIGGWNNTQHALEASINGSKTTVSGAVAGGIQPNRWYDIRVELSGRRVRCYLDGQLVHDYTSPLSKAGGIGLGTWSTRASYTNVVVAKLGQTLYRSDFTSGAPGWSVYSGTWAAAGGVYQQTSAATDCRSTTGSTNWTDYTLSLRARKDSGNEGFLILFQRRDDNNWTWWNLGGWGNTRHAIEVSANGTKTTLGTSVNGSLETNRWYDIRVELAGPRIRCYLDNVLIHDVSYPATAPLYASASYSENWGQVILKTVNVSSVPISTTLALNGLAAVSPQASYTLLTGPGPNAENTLTQPTNVAPVSGTASGIGTNFTYVFPSNSLTVLRMQTPPVQPVGIGLGVSAAQQDIGGLSDWLPVQLSSFITNDVTVSYTVDCPARIWAGGVLQFHPGDLVRSFWLPPEVLECGLVRVTLANPVNGQLTGPSRVYYARALNDPAAPPRLGWAQFPDETLLYWTDGAATLLQAPALSSAWTPVTNAVSPLVLPRAGPPRFYQLRR